MRIIYLVTILAFSLIFANCNKNSSQPQAQAAAANPAVSGWAQITPNSNTADFSDIYPTDTKLFATLPFTLCSSSDGIAWATSSLTNVWTAHEDNGKIYLGSGGFKVSTDSGATWTQKNNGLTDLNVFYIATSSAGIYLSTGNGVFYSADGGNNWASAGLSGSQPSRVAILNNKLYAISSTSLFTSSNNGTTWAAVTLTASSVLVNNVVVVGNNVLASTSGETFISTDNGITWNVIAGLGSYNFIFGKGNRVMSVTGNLNIKYSSDAGLTWVAFDNGLPVSRNLTCYSLNNTYAYVLDRISHKIYRRQF